MAALGQELLSPRRMGKVWPSGPLVCPYTGGLLQLVCSTPWTVPLPTEAKGTRRPPGWASSLHKGQCLEGGTQLFTQAQSNFMTPLPSSTLCPAPSISISTVSKAPPQ